MPLLHVLVDLLPTALVLQARLGQVDWEHTGDSYHACNPSIDQLGWQTVQRQVATDKHITIILFHTISAVTQRRASTGEKTCSNSAEVI